MTNKELNKLVENLLDQPRLYDVRLDFQVIKSGLTEEEAKEYVEAHKELYSDIQTHRIAITTAIPPAYSEDLNLAVYAARRLAERNQATFVLSHEEGDFKAAFGDWGDCAQYTGSNPAYVTCRALLLWYGKR